MQAQVVLREFQARPHLMHIWIQLMLLVLIGVQNQPTPSNFSCLLFVALSSQDLSCLPLFTSTPEIEVLKIIYAA